MNIKEILNTQDKIPVILAPMAGVTDLPCREICMRHKASFTYSEMVSAKAISYNNKKTYDLIDFSEITTPFGVQIFGHEPQTVSETAQKLCQLYEGKISVIDINMGCPAPKIVNNGDGSALMKNISLASKIIEETAKKCPIPITVKFRKGFTEESINAVEFAKMAENSGAAAITIHGRTASQMYSGKADLSIISKVKSVVAIPVVGNGDITSGESAQKMLTETGCDAIMVGRAAQGNPFIFEEIHAFLNKIPYTPPTRQQRIQTAIAHAKLHAKYKSNAEFPQMRKHLSWYIKGIPGAGRLREQIFQCSTLAQAEEILNRL